MADKSPQGIELGAAHFVIVEQDLFNLLHLRRGLNEPRTDGLFFHPFDATDCGERVPFGQHREGFDNRLLVISLAVKNRAFGFGDNLLTAAAVPALTAFARQAELAEIPGVDASVIHAGFVPAKGSWRC